MPNPNPNVSKVPEIGIQVEENGQRGTPIVVAIRDIYKAAIALAPENPEPKGMLKWLEEIFDLY